MIKSIKGRLLYMITEMQGLLYQELAFYTIELVNGKKEQICPIPADGLKILLANYRLTTRFLRLEPKCAGRLDQDRFVISILGKLWLLDIKKKKIRELCNLRSGYGVLNICESNGYIYWGDYGANPHHDNINIYRLDKDLNIEIVYSFPKNTIRHIHNIIHVEDGFIVMAGDNEKSAGIYKVNADWNEVRPWKNGEQKYRAVVGFPYKGGLLYATDSVETENHLRYIKGDDIESILLIMNGSCIYGGETKEFYLFSTTVESPEGKGLLGLFSKKLGGGIKNDEVHVVTVSKQDLSIKTIAKFKKDFWPMKLMQYGQVIFTSGQERELEGVWCYPMSCKKYDGKSVFLKFYE